MGMNCLALITLSLLLCVSHGAIWDCSGTLEWTHPARGGANHCSDENGGECLGPGRIYYGDALTFTYEDVEAGKTISCSNSAFGCDPFTFVEEEVFQWMPNEAQMS